MKIDLELLPIRVPNYILVKETAGKRQDRFKEGRKFHLSELSEDVLLKLCNDFTDEMFKKAGKVRPKEQ